MPRKLLFRMAIFTGSLFSTTVISSWMFIWMLPSPAMSMTMASGYGHLRPDGRREAVAHGPQAAGGQQAVGAA